MLRSRSLQLMTNGLPACSCWGLRRQWVPVLALALSCVLAAGCATSEQRGQPPTAQDLPFEIGADSHRLLLVRESVDLVKLADGEQRLKVQYLWDYTAGLAVRRSINADGTLRELVQLPVVTLNATDAERAYAFALARSDRRVGPRVTEDTTIYGGFSFREPGHRDCDVGSRCIHVVGSADHGRRHTFHAIIDLMSGRVVDPDFDPKMRGIDQESKPKGK